MENKKIVLSSIFSKLFIFLLLMVTFCQCHNDRIECHFSHERLCGDKCIPVEKFCFCGNGTLVYSDPPFDYCCNFDTCDVDKQNNAYCEGIIQDRESPCQGTCKQTSTFGWNSRLCENQQECYLEILSCNGMPRCNDASDLYNCGQPSTELKCKENRDYQFCEQLETVMHHNYQCQGIFFGTEDYFGCLNRSDKRDVLFSQIPVPKNKTNKGLNINLLLNFDEQRIYCGTFNSTYEKMFETNILNGDEFCTLLSGQLVPFYQLYYNILLDYSFNMSNKIEELYHSQRIEQLEYNCNTGPAFLPCGANSNFCIYAGDFCNGIANCPNGEDEDLSFCESQGVFSDLATIDCKKKDVYNLDIWIKAVKCDNVIECASGEDEAHCSIPDSLLLITWVIVTILTLLMALLMWQWTTIDLEAINMTNEDFEIHHGSSSISEIAQHMQSSTKAKVFNQWLIRMEMDHHNGLKGETVCCLKNSIDSGTVAKVMEEFSKDEEDKLPSKLTGYLRQTNYFKKIQISSQSLVMMLNIVKSAVAHSIDFVKDILLLIQIAVSQGGWTQLMAQTTPFMKGIFFAYMSSIILPLILSSLQLLSKGPKVLFGLTGKLQWMFMVVLIPVLPIFLILREAVLVQASKSYKISTGLLESTKKHVFQFIQADIGLESHLQIVVSTVLLLLAYSETRTITGMEVLFGQESLFFLPPAAAIGISILWSLYSCISSHIRGISKKREYSTGLSTTIMFLFTTVSIGLRVFSYVLYLTPGLGLFKILRHFQGEMYPYYIPFYAAVNTTTDTFYFGNASPIPWSTITRWNYKGYTNAEPPNLTLYTYFTFEQYFISLLGIFSLNVILQMIGKNLSNPKVFHRMTLIDRLIHSICSCFIPLPMEDWDGAKGTIDMHKIRKDFILKEMFASIMLNFVINLLLLSPLVILGFNIFERHDILVNSIGALPQETIAYEQIKWMIALSYTLLVLFTIFQIVSYYFYNGRCHPFALIIMNELKHDTAQIEVKEDVELQNIVPDEVMDNTSSTEVKNNLIVDQNISTSTQC